MAEEDYTDSEQNERLVDAFLLGQGADESAEATQERLIELGVAREDAPIVLKCLEKGFQAGVFDRLELEGFPNELPPGSNALFDAAYERARATMRYSSPGWVLIWRIGWWISLIVVVGAVLKFFFG